MTAARLAAAAGMPHAAAACQAALQALAAGDSPDGRLVVDGVGLVKRLVGVLYLLLAHALTAPVHMLLQTAAAANGGRHRWWRRPPRRVAGGDSHIEIVSHHWANNMLGGGHQWQVVACVVVVVGQVMVQRLGLAARGGRGAVASLRMKDKGVLAQVAHALPGVAGRQAGMQHIGVPL
jgi:hypothetical protein